MVFDEQGVAHPVESPRGLIRLPNQQVEVFAAGFDGPVAVQVRGRTEVPLVPQPRSLLSLDLPTAGPFRDEVVRVYPLNGVVDNQSSSYVMVHDCDSGELRTLAPREGTEAWSEDFDYVSVDRGASWWKLGANRVVLVDANLQDPGLCSAELCRPCGE